MNYREVLLRLREKGFVPKKHLGQNFLVDKNIVDFIVRVSSIEGKNVLEVGGGLGILTKPLSLLSKRLVVIEKDPYLYEYLREEFSEFTNVSVIHGDIMDIDLKNIFGGEDYSIVSNLPYSITSPFLFKLWDTDPPVDLMVLMLQYDVAQRIMGTKKEDRCPLYVLYSLTHRVEFLKKVSGSVFIPRPKVDSAIIRMTKVKDLDSRLKPYLRRIVDSAYRYRRKKLHKALSTEIPDLDWKTVITNLGLNPESRAEDLDPGNWLTIAIGVINLLNKQKTVQYD